MMVCRILPAKNALNSADARRIEDAFVERVTDAAVVTSRSNAGQAQGSVRKSRPARIDKFHLPPRRIRDRDHVRFVAKQPCLICGRKPSDPHHLRFTQQRALGRKVSDEFTVPLCRGHHREVHRCGDEATWWKSVGVNPTIAARALWRATHPLPRSADKTSGQIATSPASADTQQTGRPDRPLSNEEANDETKPIITGGSQ